MFFKFGEGNIKCINSFKLFVINIGNELVYLVFVKIGFESGRFLICSGNDLVFIKCFIVLFIFLKKFEKYFLFIFICYDNFLFLCLIFCINSIEDFD